MLIWKRHTIISYYRQRTWISW